MALDRKYGKVTLENGTIGEDEPVMVFRAQDKLLPALITIYMELCAIAGSPQRHLDLILENREIVEEWQAEHLTQTPNSETSKEWLGR